MISQIIDKLVIGDLRTTGYADDVVKEVVKDPGRFEEILSGLTHLNPGVRMRAADALEKVSAQKPALLQPHKKLLIEVLRSSQQQEVQWHIAQMLSYVSWTAKEIETISEILITYFNTSKSAIVRVMSLQAIVDLAQDHPHLRDVSQYLTQKALNSDFPSLRARARKIIGKKPCL